MAATDLRTGEVGGSTSEIDSGTVDATINQPDDFNYSQSNQFQVYLPLFPTTQWFVTRISIPGVQLGVASHYTPFVDIQVVGDKITYDNFNMSFIVDEKLENYMEMYNWVKNIGFPFGTEQYQSIERPDGINRGKKAMDYGTSDAKKLATAREVETSERNLYTDILVSILSSKNNPVADVTIYEAFPVSLSTIDYNQQQTDTDYAMCDVSFAYTWFDVTKVATNA